MSQLTQIAPIHTAASDIPQHTLHILISLIAGVAVSIILIFTESLVPASLSYMSSSPVIVAIHLVPGLITALLAYLLLEERRRVRELHINAARLETLLKNLPGMAYRCFNRKYWPMEFVSEGCYALCGYDRRDLEEQRVLWGTFTHPDEIERVEKTILDAVEKGEPFELEYRIITRSKNIKWVWERGRVVSSNGSNEIVLEGLITDITDRKQTETALVEAEAYSKAVVDTAVEAVITLDKHGYIESFNRAAQQMFGYRTDEIKGESIRVLMPEPHHEEYEQFVTHYLKTNESQMIGMDHDVTGKRKDQSEFPIHLSISEILNQNEKKYVGLIRDLSMQRAAEKEVREQREQLAHVDRLNTLGEMATTIAHEINQPLTAISMYAQSGIKFLERGLVDPQKLRDALEKLTTQAHRAGTVIERVQQLSRQHESQSEEVDCNLLIREVHKLAEVEAHIRDIVIRLKLSHLLPTVFCDPVQIQQVVLNLLRNGMESMKSTGCRNGNRIVLQTNRTGIGVKVSIIDSGIGISEDIADQLYLPFSSTKDTGMGMGLSISRSIIRAHGGQLEFSNNVNSGATFYFTLPYARPKRD